MSQTIPKLTVARKTFWAVAAFYLLVAFEFFYMATPFAVYFYSLYRPGLSLISNSPVLSWMGSFFLPHLAIETSSPFLNVRNEVGAVLALIGFASFCAGAAQVYYHKLTHKGTVTKGVYRLIRHPQYASLIMCGFGLLLLWPRYLALLSFVAMLFVYYALARLEERECEQKFDGEYVVYKRRTGMFLPFRVPFLQNRSFLPRQGRVRYVAMCGLYVLVSGASIALADAAKQWSISRIYVAYDRDDVFVSLTRMEKDSLIQTVHAALADPEVQSYILKSGDGWKPRLLGYIVPLEYYALEIPMTPLERQEGYHFFQQQYSADYCKIILMKVDHREGMTHKSRDLLLDPGQKTPLLEVWINVREGTIVRRIPLASQAAFQDITFPSF